MTPYRDWPQAKPFQATDDLNQTAIWTLDSWHTVTPRSVDLAGTGRSRRSEVK